MQVGFPYKMIDSLPSASGLTMVSKKGMAPYSLLSSTVNVMAVNVLKEVLFIFFPLDNRCAIHTPEPLLGVTVLSAFCSKCSM